MTERDEQWRPIVGYEDVYEVSDFGRVRSIDRVVYRSDGQTRPHRGRILLPFLSNGYEHVRLQRGGPQRAVHQLVLEAFIGLRPAGLVGCHDNGNRRDNRLANLRWDTQSNNLLDKRRHGTDHLACKPLCIRGHKLIAPNLTAHQVRTGRRGCLACGRALGSWRWFKQSHPNHDRVAWLQERSDANYRAIMGEAA